MEKSNSSDVATLAGGCFWCVEAVFLKLKGVISAESGYTGGQTKNPSYRDVCGGGTGHAEAVRVTFDPSEITYREILEVFFAVHDPTTLNRQGADVGTQYRSAIFAHSSAQRLEAERLIAELSKEEIWPAPIVTEVVDAGPFYPAEEYHRNYFERNPEQAYCQAVVAPKVAKFRKKFASKLRD